MGKTFFAALSLGALLSCATGSPPPESTATRFGGFRLITGDGSPAIENAAMFVDGGQILAIGDADSVAGPEGASEVDLSGRTVMPLLHSLHVHLGYLKDNGEMAAENYSRESVLADLQRHLHYGVGSVLSLGADVGDTAFSIREDQRQGRAGGAKLFTVGRGITAKGSWPTVIPAIQAAPQQVETEDQARAAVQGLAERKVDAVKIWVDDAGGSIPKITPELYRAVIDEANQHGLKVFAHVFYLEDAKGLVEAGVSCLAHSIRDQVVDDELVATMKEHDVLYVPTLVAHELPISHAEGSAWIGEASMRETVATEVVERLMSDAFREKARNSPGLEAAREQYQIALTNLKKLSDAGVRIGLGTDSGTTHRYPGYFEHRELELMVDAGLTPAQAIQAATQTSAAMLGESGTLGKGSEASFLVLRSNPLERITNTRDIEAVYVDGEPIERLSPPMTD
jgi:imidazolonepropionase-like amidohydrolase